MSYTTKRNYTIIVALMAIIAIIINIFPTRNSLSALEMPTEMKLTSDAISISAIVPAVLPIDVDKHGDITVSDEAKITNTSVAKIKVNKVDVTTKNGWELNEYDTDYSKEKVGIKKFGLIFNNDKVNPNGKANLTSSNWPSIKPSDSLDLDYFATVGFQKDSTELDIAEVLFTIGWDDDDGSSDSDGSGGTGETDPENPDPDPEQPDPDPEQPDPEEPTGPEYDDEGYYIATTLTLNLYLKAGPLTLTKVKMATIHI